MKKHFAPDGTKLVLKGVGESETCNGCYYYSPKYACYRTNSPFRDNCSGRSFNNFMWVIDKQQAPSGREVEDE